MKREIDSVADDAINAQRVDSIMLQPKVATASRSLDSRTHCEYEPFK